MNKGFTRLEIGLASMNKSFTHVEEGLFLRTTDNGLTLQCVSVTKGKETVLDITQMLQSFGWRGPTKDASDSTPLPLITGK